MVRDSGIRVLTMDLTAAAAEAAEAAVSPSADMLSSGPPTHAVSTAAGGDCGALFCRASFWRGPTASVLLLDRPAWEDPSSGISKRRRRSGLAVASAGAGTGTGTATEDEEEIPSFEALLAESLQLGYCESDANPDVPRLLDDIAARQWCEFFDDAAVGAQQTETSTALLWQAQSALERNLAAARLRDKMYGRGDGGDDGGGGDGSSAAAAAYEEWEALLARLGRRAQLLGQLTPIVANIQMPPSRPASPRAEYHADASDVRDQRSSSAPDENQRSLNRVSYIGGVLLPISIVSGILAMGDTYGPGGGMFYVFWAAAVPLTLLTVLVIYADSIRKAEVWIEVAAAGGSEGSPGGAAVSTPQLEQAIPYSATIDLDERMATPLPAGEDSLSETLAEPATLVEKLFPNTAGRTWRREELGWLGACATVFGIYKLKRGTPPDQVRQSRRAKRR
ncbi:hypothetical protein GGR56DRAFT_367008 [Xylariaceae sp. FL0804]|nr:hypothetical protein GGR56DRAFT_367008 [Xylariaceae sp. FL0804]